MTQTIAQPITQETLALQRPVVEGNTQTDNHTATNAEEPLRPLQSHTARSHEDIVRALQEILKETHSLSKVPVLNQQELRKLPMETEGKKSWSWTNEAVPIDQHPCFRLGSQALGLSESQAYAQTNDVADIVKMAIEHLQNGEPEVVYRYLSHFIRTTTNKSIQGIKRELAMKIAEEEGE